MKLFFSYYGENAIERGLTQHIPGKPYDFGLVTYLLAQPLEFIGLAIFLAACPTWLVTRPTSYEVALRLLSFGPTKMTVYSHQQHLIADSLWSTPNQLKSFTHSDVSLTIAIKDVNTWTLRLASSDIHAIEWKQTCNKHATMS